MHAITRHSPDRSLRDLPLGLVVIAVLPADAVAELPVDIGAELLPLLDAHFVRVALATGLPLPTLSMP